MRSILVPVADRPECQAALKQAFKIADELSASVTGCHLRPQREESRRSRERHFLLQFGRDNGESKKLSGKQVDLRSTAARRLFTGIAKSRDFQLVERPVLGKSRCAMWYEMVGSLDRLFRIAGPVTDFSILSRPKRKSSGQAVEFVLSAVLHSGKPVMILPQKGVRSVGSNVLIAWNQSIEAARAVTAALPLLVRAESVTICSCGPENSVGPKSSALVNYLKMWGVKSRRVSTRGHDVKDELRETYKESGSDLVVMGAYSRNRLREVVFGGMTEHMLFHSNMPVFMQYG
ncbi:MAG: universal stress protein [Gammaproteobacteria bacterium]|nr:universal stress protein [Gammaproteobacteria bacterium]NNF60176.1 universal stress protein [Gammaproteobacteria bacterium]NNM21589.1 universal stress protein [Gammaproteobacteria bacterium]